MNELQSAFTPIAMFINIFTPAIVDVIKRPTWNPKLTVLVSLLISTVGFVLLHALMGTLPYPLTEQFLKDLLAAYSVQQLVYSLVFKDRNPDSQTTTTTTVMPAGAAVVQETVTHNNESVPL